MGHVSDLAGHKCIARSLENFYPCVNHASHVKEEHGVDVSSEPRLLRGLRRHSHKLGKGELSKVAQSAPGLGSEVPHAPRTEPMPHDRSLVVALSSVDEGSG